MKASSPRSLPHRSVSTIHRHLFTVGRSPRSLIGLEAPRAPPPEERRVGGEGTGERRNNTEEHMKRLESHFKHNKTTTNVYLPTQGTQFLLLIYGRA